MVTPDISTGSCVTLSPATLSTLHGYARAQPLHGVPRERLRAQLRVCQHAIDREQREAVHERPDEVRLIPAALAALYVVIVGATWGKSPAGFSSLSAVSQLFESPWMLLAGWVHYLAFDLFAGSWIARDSRERGIAHPWIPPCLLLTFLFGPAGWLSYLGLRAALRPRTIPASVTRKRGKPCDACALARRP